MTVLHRVSHAALFLALISAPVLAQSSSGIVSGTVSLPSPDGQSITVPGVTVTMTCPGVEQTLQVTDDEGHFRFAETPSGTCSVTADLQGFKSAIKTVVVKPNETVDLALRLDTDVLHEEVTVTGHAQATDSTSIAANVETLNLASMQLAPIASDRFQDALPLIPGVVRGPDGLLNIGGARSNQSAYKFNNADGTDPVTGDDAIELPIDAVSSVQVLETAFAPEHGLSTGAVTIVDTQSGGDKWHTTVNDLEPRPRIRDGAIHGLESWTPRGTVGGPLVAGKVNLLQSVQLEYSQTRVYDLPPLESDTKVQSIESYSRLDWTVSPTNHFTGSALILPRKTTYAGLTPLNPQPVTPDIKKHVVFGTVSDQIVGNRGVLENTVSVKTFDATIYPAVGNGPMVFAPEESSGSYFNSTSGTSRRAEWLTTYSFAPIGPAHVVKLGAAARYETVDGVSTGAPVEILREDRTLSSLTTFVGDGRVDLNRRAIKGFAQDTWTVSPRLTVIYGVRNDYDSFNGDVNVAPRGSFTASLTEDGRTILRGGGGLFYTPLPLNVAVFDRLQGRTITDYEADGVTPLGPASTLRNVVGSEVRTPRSVNATAELDRELVKNLFVRVSAQQRKTEFEPILDVSSSSIALLTAGNSRYREGEVTARYQFHGHDQIVGSYTRSSAVGDLNDYNSYYGAIQNPIIRPNQRGPLPFDAPNRWLFWSNLSLPRQITVFPVVDVRTGFPYSIIDEDRNFVGARNEAGRYPTFVSLDTQVSKRFLFKNHPTTVGVKVFNITDHDNPRDFQNNSAATDFERFYNSVGRTLRGKFIFEF